MNKLAILTVLTATLLSSVALAAGSTVSSNLRIKSIRPLTMTVEKNLSFGELTLLPDQSTIAISTSLANNGIAQTGFNNARIKIAGEPNQNYILTVPATVTLTSAGRPSLTAQIFNYTGTDPNGTFKMHSSGENWHDLMGLITLNGTYAVVGQEVNYSGNFLVTANY